ncbi:MAG: serine/threonine protein kinase [Planctomycetia bacterium]|nr:serine/threonine protein kinase [Planctomycetia bacterium]
MNRAIEVDAICDSFENAWKRGLRPRMEDFLESAAPGIRGALLRELILVDRDYRRRSDKTPDVSDYLARFPGQPDVVRDACQRDPEHSQLQIQFSHFAKLRKAVEEGIITDTFAERLLRGTPIGSSLLETASSTSDLSQVAVDQLSSILDEGAAPANYECDESDSVVAVTDELELADPSPAIDAGREEYVGLPLRYQLIRILGEGGMGLVFHAFDRQLRRAVAVKVLPVHDSTKARAMQHECHILARLNHPGIVSIYDSGHLQDGRPFVVMELVEGVRFDKLSLASNYSESQIVEAFKLCAESVAVAHYLRIVHRDLKPSNVLLTSDGRPKVLDFGLARFLDADTKDRADRAGTLSYASPEQLLGETVDERSDVYSLGVMLFHALSSAFPVSITSGMTLDEVLGAKKRFEPLRRRVPRVSRALEAIVHKCLSYNPSERYASASALADDLGSYLRRQPFSASPRQSFLYWLEKQLSPGGAALMLLLTAGAVTLMSLVAGFPMATIWPILAVLVGLQAGTLLLREAQDSRRGALTKVCIYTAGFVLLFEAILVVAMLAKT